MDQSPRTGRTEIAVDAQNGDHDHHFRDATKVVERSQGGGLKLADVEPKTSEDSDLLPTFSPSRTGRIGEILQSAVLCWFSPSRTGRIGLLVKQTITACAPSSGGL